MKTDIKKLENAQIEIKATLPAKDLETYRDAVVEEAIKHVKIDGFRDGKVPRDMALKELDAMKILEEMAHRAISAKYVDILQQHDIKAIGHPQIQITKIAEGADLEFTIVTAVLPEVTLPDYKKIAKTENNNKETVEVTDEDLAETLKNLQKMSAQQKMVDKVDDLVTGEAGGEKPTSWNDIKDEDLPELTDEWAQGMGDFKTLDEFKAKITENLKAEKESKAVEKKRIVMIDAILADADIEVPDMMVDYEVQKMMHEFESNIAMTGISFDDYLKQIGKTREDYQQEWREQGLKRAQTQLMLNHIAAQEKIDPKDEDIEAEVSKIMEQYKDQKGIDENNVRAYVATVLTHQKVFEFLESQK